MRREHTIVELPEAYSRVTNPERFRPLVAHALEVCAELRAKYDVVESVAFDVLPGLMRPFPYSQPPIALTPVDPSGAPIAVGFTTFPSVIVRYGRWHATGFPNCGCDACAENAFDESVRFDDLVRSVVEGQFTEELRVPFFGDGRLYETWTALPGGAQREGWTTIQRSVASALRGDGPRRVEWRPWSLRAT